MTTANVLKQGNSQAVRLPEKFRLAKDTADIHHEGEAIMLPPKSSARRRHVCPCLCKLKDDSERNPAAQPGRREG